MPQSLAKILVHTVFSTKDRRPYLRDQALREEMHRYLAIANYEDRFVIPTAHREVSENAYALRGNCGFSFGNGCDSGEPKSSLFGGKMGRRKMTPIRMVDE